MVQRYLNVAKVCKVRKDYAHFNYYSYNSDVLVNQSFYNLTDNSLLTVQDYRRQDTKLHRIYHDIIVFLSLLLKGKLLLAICCIRDYSDGPLLPCYMSWLQLLIEEDGEAVVFFKICIWMKGECARDI